MNTYHQTIWRTSRWIDEESMTYAVPLGLKHHEKLIDVEIQDKSFITSVKTDDGLVLCFDREKVVETCKKETFYEGWEVLMCTCCTQQFILTEEEYTAMEDKDDMNLETVTTRYFVPIPTMRIEVSY